MEYNFDKEINALLRNEARNVTIVSSADVSHLDADEISAFAENALPVKWRVRATKHLANCDNCRISLSNVIALNSEFSDETPAKIDKKEIVAAPVPWYRRIFAQPNLAYGLGALLLVFSGLVAFVAVRNFNPNSELSQIREQKSSANRGFEEKQDSVKSDSLANANVSLDSNAAVPDSQETPIAENSADLIEGARDRVETAKKPAAESSSDSEPKQAEPISTPPPSAENQTSGRISSTTSNAENKALEAKDEAKSVDEDKADNNYASGNPVMSRKSAPPVKRTEEDERAKLKSLSVETTSVGGKNFKRLSNVWVDTDYQNQATIKITRGTKEYKRLDKDLRVIVENLGGIVIIVWKETAYRIQ